MSSAQDLDTQCAEAMARITASVNRSAGQHLRAMRFAWALHNQLSNCAPLHALLSNCAPLYSSSHTNPTQPTPGA